MIIFTKDLLIVTDLHFMAVQQLQDKKKYGNIMITFLQH